MAGITITCGACKRQFTKKFIHQPTMIDIDHPLILSTICPYCKAQLTANFVIKTKDSCSECKEPSGVLINISGNQAWFCCPRCHHAGPITITQRVWHPLEANQRQSTNSVDTPTTPSP